MDTVVLKDTRLDQVILILSIISTAYFALVFSGAFSAIDHVVVHALFELFTLPLILVPVLILLNAIRYLVTGSRSLNLLQAVPAFLSFAVILCMFFVD